MSGYRNAGHEIKACFKDSKAASSLSPNLSLEYLCSKATKGSVKQGKFSIHFFANWQCLKVYEAVILYKELDTV